MSLPICVTCGVQYDEERFDPAHCKVCEDERQYVGWEGQRWTTLEDMRRGEYRGDLRPEHGDVWGIGTSPEFGIGQRALLVPGDGGNVLWDSVSYLDDELVAQVRARGGIAAIAVSHPHFYSSVVEWSRAFDDAPIYLHAADREWLCRDGNVVWWEGDTAEILPGRTLVNCGTHFAGGAVLHWPDGAGGRGALFTGDIVAVMKDRRYVSFMYSFPNEIPESPQQIARALRLLEPLPFEVVYGAWWGTVTRRDGKAALARSAERYLKRIGAWPPPDA